MQKLRIKIRGYDSKVVDGATKQIIDTAIRTGAKTRGPVPLPTKRNVFVTLTSPHIDSKSKDHFELKTHIRLLEILSPTDRTVESLTHLQLPAGVWIEIK